MRLTSRRLIIVRMKRVLMKEIRRSIMKKIKAFLDGLK